MKNFPFVIIITLLLAIGAFLFFNLIFAQTPSEQFPGEAPPPEEETTPAEQFPGEAPPPEEEECISEITCSSYCVGGCDGELWETCCDSCNGCWDTLIEDCDPWQMCSTGGCSCESECLEAPQNPRYYDNPTYSDQPDKDIGDKNIKLPIKLDWDDVPGWQKEEGPQSYSIRITTSTGTFSDVLSESEYIPKVCALPSNETINWRVKACCTADGQNCGPESNWPPFTTNLAPEPIWPYDPDWTGEKGGENVSLPITLEWCDVKEAEFYKLRFYLKEEGEKTCHPWLKTSEGCDTVLIGKEPTLLLPSQFNDEDWGYFTKATKYLWEIATYFVEKGRSIEIFSQLWQFNTAEEGTGGTLSGFNLVYPPNDPGGRKPVGLPLTLDWEGKPGMNSFNYTVGPFSGTTLSSEVTFDYPQLSLNTPYKWTVEPCWDYEGDRCETDLTKEGYFKTTGAAPKKIIYPRSGDSDVPIPINFDWEDVSGAKSYILKISGDGLSEEIVIDGKSEVSLDFPEFNIRQEKNYTWQVKTCAWAKGKACGNYGNSQTFTTFKLPPPEEPISPQNNGQLSTDEKSVSWEKVEKAKVYQYQIKYLSLAEKEKSESCPALVGKNLFENPQNVFGNSDYVELKCLGNYQWQVRACLDEGCQEVGEWSKPWSFSLVEPGEIKKDYGLIPCGQSFNNPKTPWNERKPCQIKHIFLLIKIIIDFIFTRLIPLALVLLALATGVMFYLSLGGKVIPIIRIKRMWKWAIVGLFLAFFAWTLVNLVLKLIGYQVGIFGNWYQL
jgi:hypothetical protein